MRKKYPEDLSLEEVQFLLVAQGYASRKIRLERFCRTGQVKLFVNDSSLIDGYGYGTVQLQTIIRDARPRMYFGFYLSTHY